MRKPKWNKDNPLLCPVCRKRERQWGKGNGDAKDKFYDHGKIMRTCGNKKCKEIFNIIYSLGYAAKRRKEKQNANT